MADKAGADGLPPGRDPERACIFVDGSNFYHGLERAGVKAQGQLSFAKIATKLVGPRKWIALRYYVGQVRNDGDKNLYANQRSFVSRQQALDKRITFHFGRIEPRPSDNKLCEELFAFVLRHKAALSPALADDLGAMARKHRNAKVMVEKAVDVMLATDLVVMSECRHRRRGVPLSPESPDPRDPPVDARAKLGAAGSAMDTMGHDARGVPECQVPLR